MVLEAEAYLAYLNLHLKVCSESFRICPVNLEEDFYRYSCQC